MKGTLAIMISQGFRVILAYSWQCEFFTSKKIQPLDGLGRSVLVVDYL